ncbi:MAG TPA: hypothetical protein VF599_15260, partial [Pyrinomonadaceae bacterium]
NILNVVRASEKSLPGAPAKLTAKARRLIYKNFSTCLKPRELRDVLPLNGAKSHSGRDFHIKNAETHFLKHHEIGGNLF